MNVDRSLILSFLKYELIVIRLKKLRLSYFPACNEFKPSTPIRLAPSRYSCDPKGEVAVSSDESNEFLMRIRLAQLSIASEFRQRGFNLLKSGSFSFRDSHPHRHRIEHVIEKFFLPSSI